jgi:pyridoxine 5-phosphate synthase
VEAAKKAGAEYIEMHTGSFSGATGEKQNHELQRLIDASRFGHSLGLNINAGHGIDYENIALILQIPWLKELNIGHSIVARAITVGIGQAVKEMVDLMAAYKG